jgi:hypothetical protein
MPYVGTNKGPAVHFFTSSNLGGTTPNVAVHVVQAPGVGSLASDRVGVVFTGVLRVWPDRQYITSMRFPDGVNVLDGIK